MSDNIFGGATPDEELPDFVQDNPAPEPQTEVPPPEPPVEEIPAPEGQPGETVLSEEEVSQDQPAVEPSHVWAGKYQSPEELEKGYRELRELQRRTAERAKAYEQHTSEVEARLAQYEEALRRAIPLVQQAVQQRQQVQQPPSEYGFEGQQPQPQQPMVSPEMVQNQIDLGVQRKMAEFQQQQQAQFQQQQEYTQAAATMKGFFERHPEVEQGGTQDEDVAATIMALNEAWPDTEVDLTSAEALDAAYEASQRPALRQILEMHPQYFDSETGMRLARQMASQIDGITQTPEAPVTRTAAPRPNTPVVERGGSQQPPQGTPLDEYEQAVAEYRKDRQRGSDVFFGG